MIARIIATGCVMLTLSTETEALVLAKAKTAGKTPEQIIREALELTAPHDVAPSHPKASLADLLAIANRAANRPRLDARSAEAIIGYNDLGLPE